MSNPHLTQDLWLEDLMERAESLREHAEGSVNDIEQYLAHGEYERAEELLIKLENEVPMMLDGRENE